VLEASGGHHEFDSKTWRREILSRLAFAQAVSHYIKFAEEWGSDHQAAKNAI